MSPEKTIQQLRERMKEHGIHAFLIPSSDPHQNEYVPEFWQRRRFLTGFTGSAGEAVVTLTNAGLWTDSRYFIQAQEQLEGSPFTLFKSGLPGVPTINEWLIRELKPGEILGIDPRVVSHTRFQELKVALEKEKLSLKSIPNNLVDAVWENRPASPHKTIRLLEEHFSGEGTASKLERLRGKMEEENADVHILSKLDSIAWLFNIRGTDIPYNPVVIAYALIERDKARLFIEPEKLTESTRRVLESNTEIFPYEKLEQAIQPLAENKSRFWLDPDSTSQWMADMVGSQGDILYKNSPVELFKAVKNPTELKGMTDAHIRDGVAVVRFLSWLKKAIGEELVTEISAARRLEGFRTENEFFQGLSFPTISSYGDHGAIVHYSPSPESDRPLKPEGIYLIDSGGQYCDGTTDITRTISLGKATDEQRDIFTRILKGVIGLTTAVFPKGTVGKQLDTLARLPLWEIGLNYLHGTGHGIGHFLNVHEGPQAISYYKCLGVPFEPGMVTSIEPAYYREGDFGMRIENVVCVIQREDLSGEQGDFYGFETLTLCPIDRALIKVKLLCAGELKWLDRYHRRVYETIAPFLNEEESDWLKNATRPVSGSE
ncbi:MAG: aminopeptidase P family protein [Candidatus Aminicenantes bacterium]|nr:aminopeptidase P family protein [Candidatus Aminicenantes bacterium]